MSTTTVYIVPATTTLPGASEETLCAQTAYLSADINGGFSDIYPFTNDLYETAMNYNGPNAASYRRDITAVAGQEAYDGGFVGASVTTVVAPHGVGLDEGNVMNEMVDTCEQDGFQSTVQYWEQQPANNYGDPYLPGSNGGNCGGSGEPQCETYNQQQGNGNVTPFGNS